MCVCDVVDYIGMFALIILAPQSISASVFLVILLEKSSPQGDVWYSHGGLA